jgi:predicted SAM-dependent methyltransferase
MSGGPRRMNFGCGPFAVPDWLNCDRLALRGVDLCSDLRSGLPLRDATFDYVVAVHVLQDLAYFDLPLAVRELRRVLRPGGVLRLVLPDLERAIAAFREGDAAYFQVPDTDARTLGAKLVTQVIWYGSLRTPFTFDFARELLESAGFVNVLRCAHGCTASAYPDIVRLDNRPRESLHVEASRP